MNIILDRFPLNSYLEAKCALEKSGHAVSLGVLTCQSVIPENFHDDFFVDRDVARGIVTDGATWILDKHNLKKASHHEGLAINVFSRYDIGQKNFSTKHQNKKILLNFAWHISEEIKLYVKNKLKFKNKVIDIISQHYLIVDHKGKQVWKDWSFQIS